ncbi:LysR substrate-binding domain-containing protein [Yoonia sediminilitoris]|uniref:LysR family transcriptional regulator n=1 Tax=Yoonia sediminilitoris TaxID=1286148 RepID=A0A2T6KIX9_9RHOB|nr:LysR substrate-binding domain-containing protein [Yoonia sediminilitoris]PUB15658.1 LysR family transcriptional regulator [Yoonia sediminilitoris]RCW96267.1 LysR family transcriptional regulator [Yoonia sediminilitoris]
MLKTLPFSALRTLEAVVRLRGFGRAADELNVTQSAVSQQIKQLESWIGTRLLIRRSRQTLPTEAGERLAQATREGVGLITAVCDDLRGAAQEDSKRILVGSPPGFAFLWLLPRLLHFDDQNPQTLVSLSTDPQARDPYSGDADLFISYSAGGFPGLHAELLMTETMSPVCAPQVAQSLTSLDDLANQVILQDQLDSPDFVSNWAYWANESGLALPHFSRTRQYGQANLVVQAAIQGLGIAMGRGPLVADAIAKGKLVHPFPEFVQSQFSYWFVCDHAALKSQKVDVFRSWLHETVQTKDS